MSEPDYKILNSEADFGWHKKELDVSHKHHHEHTGSPERYPCGVISVWAYNDNGPDWYNHSFVYQQEVSCCSCGHKTLVWPEQA